MNRIRRLLGAIGVAMVALVAAAPATPALAGTFTHYGPPNAPAWSLSGHAVAGGAGTLPNDYPAPKPWNLAAGDYCTAYKFAQPNAPTTRLTKSRHRHRRLTSHSLRSSAAWTLLSKPGGPVRRTTWSQLCAALL